ncbi:MAG: glycosyltransferase family 2 protein [Candidatus Aenigmarchaeota archaeon]|nr:glycosyltransferase family 2 protein [Candidatus Aenigmarchaeota archaeon]
MKVSIIIPTYNERENLPIAVERIFKVFKENRIEGEVVVVDDNSPDKTGKIAERLKKRHKMQVLHRRAKLGLSSAVLEGFNVAKGEILGVMDADLSHPPETIPKLIKAIENGADIAVASRYIKNGGIEGWGIKRKVISKAATFLAKGLTSLADPVSGFFFLKKDVLDEVELNPKGYKIGLEIFAKSKDKKIMEVPYVFFERKLGKSKLNLKEIGNYILHLSSLYFFKAKQFFKFCIVGGLGTIVNLAILYSLVEFAGLWYIIAAALAFVIAATHNYILNKIWTFEDKRAGKKFIAKQWSKFFVISVFSLGINLFVLWSLVEFAGLWYIFAQIIAIFVALFNNFLGNKYWTFRMK